MDNLQDRLRKLMMTRGYTAKDLGGISKVGYRTIENWLSARKAIPRVDFAVSVARSLDTTAEFLVDGDDGVEYVRNLVANEGSTYRPPERLASLVEDLNAIDDSQLDVVKKLVRALAGEIPDRAVRES